MTQSTPSPCQYYIGPERRHASKPRRKHADRRHRYRTEAMLSDCRSGEHRRQEDEDGFIEIAGLYNRGDF